MLVLPLGQSMIVQACLDVEVTDDYSQQSIGDCIILTSNVFNGCGIIRTVDQMSLLVSRPGVSLLGKGKGERLMVSAYHKIVGLQ